jgi:hypothetical protein
MSEQVFLRGKNLTPAVRSLVPLVIIAAIVSALALHAVLYGPAIQERAEQLQAEQIDQQNRTLCEKLGIAHGSERFTACADVLSEARRQEVKRFAKEVAGIL